MRFKFNVSHAVAKMLQRRATGKGRKESENDREREVEREWEREGEGEHAQVSLTGCQVQANAPQESAVRTWTDGQLDLDGRLLEAQVQTTTTTATIVN